MSAERNLVTAQPTLAKVTRERGASRRWSARC